MFSEELLRFEYNGRENKQDIEAVISKIESGLRPTLGDARVLLLAKNPEHYEKTIAVASKLTEENHGNQVGLIAPLYFSNVCRNECSCCDMSRTNKDLERRTLNFDEFTEELGALQSIGYKTFELVGGGFPLKSKVGDRFLQFMDHGRKQVPNWAFFVDTFEEQDYQQIADPNITMIHWQESYDKEAYQKMVKSGPKLDFERRLNAQDFWLKAGGQRYGLSVLAGLSEDFLRDVHLTLAHGRYLEDTYGFAPTCFGTVRMQAIKSKDINQFSSVPDKQMYLATAMYRIMFPKANIITTSRESQEVIAKQLVAGATFTNTTCTTVPGGYASLDSEEKTGQFHHENPSIERVEATLRSVGKAIDWNKQL